MQSARARDQLPPTMDHKGTVEISSEYHAVGGMGIGQPAVTFSTRGTFLFMAKRIFFFLDSVQLGTQLHAWLPVFTCQLQITQERLTIKFLFTIHTPSYETTS